MLRKLLFNKKSLVIVPLALALALTGVFLPLRGVSVEPSGMLSIESRVVVSVGYEAAYANPDTESLWSGSNAVSTTQLTLTSTANADGSTTGNYADASGLWAKAPYEYWTFTMDNSAVGAGTINSVTLYLKHYQSGWADDNFNIDVYDGSTWNTVQSYTSGSGPPTTDTTNSWAVAALDTWTKIDAAQVRIIGNGQSKAEDSVDWFVDTVELRVDYTPAATPDIANTPSTHNFGTVSEGTDYWSSGSAPTWPLDDGECLFEVTNNTAQAVDIVIKSTDFTGGTPGWTLTSGAPGTDTVRLRAGVSGDSVEGDMVILTTSDQAFITGLAASATKKWELKIETPATFSNGDAKSATVTLTATLS